MVNRKIAVHCLVATLILSSTSLCFGAEDAEEIPVEQAPVVKTIANLDFTGPTIELSLEQAIKDALTDGSAIRAADIKRQSDRAEARSNQESVSGMETANREAREAREEGMWQTGTTYGRSEIDRARKATDYYRTMATRNYDAAVNQIVYSITNSYYSLLHAGENVRIAEESPNLQEQILRITEQRFLAGVAANQDVMQAEINVNSARAELAQAVLSLAERKMIFNEDLGYIQMQDVKLTTPLKRAELSELSLEEALSEALENRNELFTCAYNIARAESELASLRGFSNSSASVLRARNAVVSAEKSWHDTENAIMREVRMNYANMLNNQAQIANSELSAERAKASLEIYLVRYELGISTLSDIQQAQIESYRAEKSLVDAILKFNLSVLEYDQSATVGRNVN